MTVIRRDKAAIYKAQQGRLEAARARHVAAVNQRIGQMREAIGTPIFGQDAVYAAKEAEAARYIRERPEGIDGFPFMAAEVGILAATPGDVAHIWLAAAEKARREAAAIERSRMVALQRLRACQSLGELERVSDAVMKNLNPYPKENEQ